MRPWRRSRESAPPKADLPGNSRLLGGQFRQLIREHGARVEADRLKDRAGQGRSVIGPLGNGGGDTVRLVDLDCSLRFSVRDRLPHIEVVLGDNCVPVAVYEEGFGGHGSPLLNMVERVLYAGPCSICQ